MTTVVFDFPNMTTTQYDDVCRRANVSDSNPPEGLIFHCASPTGTSLLVTDVWDSEEKFRKFGEQLMPAMDAIGIQGIQPKIYPTYATIRGRSLVHR